MFQKIRLFSLRPPPPPKATTGSGSCRSAEGSCWLGLFLGRTDCRAGQRGLSDERKPKFQDKFGFKELAGNWSESFFPALGQPSVCLSVPFCTLGVKSLGASGGLSLGGVAVTQLLLSLFII